MLKNYFKTTSRRTSPLHAVKNVQEKWAFLKLVAVSCIVTFPVAWWMMHNWLQNYEYRIEISWWIFLIAGFMAMLIALVIVSFQAIKAAIANPVKSLRTE